MGRKSSIVSISWSLPLVSTNSSGKNQIEQAKACLSTKIKIKYLILVFHNQTDWSIFLPANLIHWYSLTVSCGISPRTIDSRLNQYDATEGVFISDPGSGYDESVNTLYLYIYPLIPNV